MPAPGRRVAAPTTWTLFPAPRTRARRTATPTRRPPPAPASFPHTFRRTRGGGAAFMELQFYPPGHAPFVDSISCDNAHRCAAPTIDSPEVHTELRELQSQRCTCSAPTRSGAGHAFEAVCPGRRVLFNMTNVWENYAQKWL